MQVLFFIFSKFFPSPARRAARNIPGCSLPVTQERAQAMVRVLAAAAAVVAAVAAAIIPATTVVAAATARSHTRSYSHSQPLFEPQPQQKMMIRIRMIHRQLLPPQPLLQHIDNYLLSEMETVLRSQSILCRRCLDVRPGWERFIFSLASSGGFRPEW